jgi:hypothetical protein
VADIVEEISSSEYAIDDRLSRLRWMPLIAYATTSGVKAHAETRRNTMAAWTMEVLKELALESWAGIFRFTSAVGYTMLYEEGQALFTKPVWYRPDAPTTAMPLLG